MKKQEAFFQIFNNQKINEYMWNFEIVTAYKKHYIYSNMYKIDYKSYKEARIISPASYGQSKMWAKSKQSLVAVGYYFCVLKKV